jgi:hypothetical protein
MTTTVRIGSVDQALVVDWLESNVGKRTRRELTPLLKGTMHTGIGWCLIWRPFGSGWFMDVTFDDPKLAVLFSLRWK